jgi:4-amino-4-deoxy-L-arabinose transferase-like glycosyltransferase
VTRHAGWAVLVLLCAALALPRTGARDLWNPNEPTYGRAVVEMAERGAWLLPTVNGETFAEKPILYYWLARVAGLALGRVDELTLRLPSAAAGILAVLLTYLLVLPYAGRRRATIAGVVLATTYLVFWSARTAQMDLLVTATALAAILCAVRVVDLDLAPVRGWALAGAAAGAGVLAKGPVGLLLPGLVVLAYLAIERRLATALRPALLAGLASFCVVALPWHLLLGLRGESAALAELLWRQNFRRFVLPWDHQAPWWYFLAHFWIDMAPWSLFVPLAAGLRPADERERRLHRLAWCWLIVVVVFFSLSASKRSAYILPAAPAVAVLVSSLATRRLAGRMGAWRTRIAAALHLVPAAAFLGLFALAHSELPRIVHADEQAAGAIRVAAFAALAAGLLICAGVALSRLSRLAAPIVLAAVVAAFYVLVAVHVLPAVNALKSPRAFGEAVARHVGPAGEVRGFHPWRWRAGYSFYARRSIPHIDSADELRAYWSGPERVYLIVEQGRVEEARRILGPLEQVEHRKIGSNEAWLFANR